MGAAKRTHAGLSMEQHSSDLGLESPVLILRLVRFRSEGGILVAKASGRFDMI